MSLLIFPSVVWALDDIAEARIGRWYKTIDSDTRRFVRCGRSVDDVRSQVQEFARASYGEELLPQGVSLTEQTRATVVLVASAFGGESFGGWGATESALDEVSRLVVELERIRILLADTDHVEGQRPSLSTSGARAVPWLVSTRVDTGHALADADLNRCLDQLLRGLLLADRSRRGDGKSVFDVAERPDTVRLFAYPSVSPHQVLHDLGTLFASALLFDASERRSDRSEPPAETLRRSRAAIAGFRSGSRRADHVLQAILGQAGLGQWSADQLMSEASGVLRELIARLEEPLIADAPAAPSPGLWERIEAAIRLIVGQETRNPSTPKGPDVPSSERDYVIGRLRLAKNMLDDLVKAGGTLRPKCAYSALPGDLWKRELRELLTTRLAWFAGGTPIGGSEADGVFEQLRQRAIGYAAEQFSDAVRAWDVTELALRDSVRQLANGVPWRFTGRVLAGRPHLYAVAASEDVPNCADGMTRLRYWRAAGMVLFGSSAIVPCQELSW